MTDQLHFNSSDEITVALAECGAAVFAYRGLVRDAIQAFRLGVFTSEDLEHRLEMCESTMAQLKAIYYADEAEQVHKDQSMKYRVQLNQDMNRLKNELKLPPG